VRGQRNLPAPRQRFRDTVNPALSCALSVRRSGWGVSPLTPYPSPFQGRGGPVLFSQPIKHNNLPSPPPGERGGVRGQRNLPVPRQPFRDTVNPALSCTVLCCAWLGASPLTPYPSPLPGERGQCSFTTNKTQQSPLAPTGGEGRVRGQRNLPAPH
jgi:hypothetical protein